MPSVVSPAKKFLSGPMGRAYAVWVSEWEGMLEHFIHFSVLPAHLLVTHASRRARVLPHKIMPPPPLVSNACLVGLGDSHRDC